MAAEGVWPKETGDIFFASDANRLLGFGDGTDGAYNDSGNLAQGTVFQYTTFDLTNGNTLTTGSTSGKPIYIFVQGDCNIAGTVDLDGKGYDSGVASADLGIDGTAGENFQRRADYGTAPAGGLAVKTGGSAVGATAAGTQDIDAFQIFNAIYTQVHMDSGQGGGGGGGARPDSAQTPPNGRGGDGGNGGSSIIFIVGGDFTFGATGIITLDGDAGSSGNNGEAGLGAGGGGGGGGGGSLWVLYKGTLTNSGSITVTAGAAGAGGTGGGGQQGGAGGGGGASITTDGSGGGGSSGGNGDGGNGGAGGAGTSLIQQIINTFPGLQTTTF